MYASRPSSIVRSLLFNLLEHGDHRLNQIERVLIHCGYLPKLTVTIKVSKDYYHTRSVIKESRYNELNGFLSGILEGQHSASIDIEFGGDDYLKKSKLAYLMLREKEFRSIGMMGKIELDIYKNSGEKIQFSQASSGELSLITSLMFILGNIYGARQLFIDEPENSLHPKWQREYVPLLLDLIGYHDVEIFIATHSPLVVTGAQLEKNIRPEFFHPETGKIEILDTTNIEELLWGQFDTIPPASRFLSEMLSEKLDELHCKKISIEDAIAFIASAKKASFDEAQTDLFIAAEKMAYQIHMGG
ncbi:AAA family ATPase [Pseudomonas mandelii]|uniref:AAA family ATPase n=1 Tax=Pseudomonas mandelii TaxID=75612 RepID=UPI00398CC93E